MDASRREFLQASAAIAGAIGVNPAAVLQSLAGASPAKTIAALIELKEKLDNSREILDGSLFRMFEPPVSGQPMSDQEWLVRLDQCDDAEIVRLAADAYAKKAGVIFGRGECASVIDKQLQSLINGKSAFAHGYQEISRMMGVKILQDFAQRRRKCNRDRGKIEGFIQSCAKRPTVEELVKQLMFSYPHCFLGDEGRDFDDAVNAVMGNGEMPDSEWSRQIGRQIDDLVARTLGKDESSPEMLSAISRFLRKHNSWRAFADEGYAAMYSLDLYSPELSLFHAISPWEKEKSDLSERLEQRLLGNRGVGQYKLRVDLLGHLVKSGKFTGQIGDFVKQAYEAEKTNFETRWQHRETQREHEPQKREKRMPEESAQLTDSNLSEDTRMVFTAMQHPHLFGKAHSWFEHLLQERRAVRNCPMEGR